MGEEWRLLIELDAEGMLAPVVEELVAELEEVGVHRAGESLVAYADSPEAAGAAERHLRRALERHSLGHLEPAVERWDHDEQEWKPDGRDSSEAPDTKGLEPTRGEPYGPWIVTVSVPHHRDARVLAEELTAEGYEVSSSWHAVEVTTGSRHDADVLVAEVGLRAPGAETKIRRS